MEVQILEELTRTARMRLTPSRFPAVTIRGCVRVNKPPDARFERLLPWYSKQWREKHGAVLVGTLLDQADSEDRAAPTVAEHVSAPFAGATV